MRFSDLVTFEPDAVKAQVLVVACITPSAKNPHYGVFTRRQIDEVRQLGVGCDVLAIAGHRSPMAYLAAAAMLAKLCLSRGRSYDLVHAHGGETAIVATLYRRAPLLVSYLGSDLLGNPSTNGRTQLSFRLRMAVIRLDTRLTAATITKSAAMELKLPKKVRRRNRVIPSGVDREQFKPRSRAEARTDLGWDPDELVVLFASNPAVPLKRAELARAVCAEACSRLGHVRLFIAHGLAPEVMPDVMNASDCLLHTSAVEGSPNVIKEALACNLPVVATAVGDIPDRLDGVNDCYVCAPSVADMSAALVRCLTPPRRTNGRDLSGPLSAELIAAEIVSVYADIIEGHDRDGKA